MTTPPQDITQLLIAWGQGDAAAGAALLPALYEDLRGVAGRAMRREDVGHTLQTTALVHEAYLRLVDQRRAGWKNKAQFLGVAAQMMRRVLVDHARERHAGKRGGGAPHVTLNDEVDGSDESADVLGLHEALERLAQLDPEQARLVELRYFAGLTIEETATALGISPATAKREWAVARAWLKRELSA
jgi:RNA polymerase sigma factor (TIGR02999 family)